ncbi:MAG: carbohydrate ABC transporter substrate-binding protein [Lachnospiraceae bacterium]|nr:carbohydrate ABC transporter substrate-binding protein [Lachnospiraceae bacterium]
MALSLALAMGLSLVACGKDDKKDDTTAPATTEAEDSATTEAADKDTEASDGDATVDTSNAGGIAAPSTDGWDSSKKIYAYSWDDDFANKVQVVLDKYPEYSDYLELVVLGCKSEESLERIDEAFDSDKYPSLIPADIGSAKYYTEDDSKTANLLDLGFTEDMWADNYDYAKQFATYNGQIKAVTWQSTAGSVIYNRTIAKEVFGTDDPDEIQKLIGDWDSFFEAADTLKDAGYKIVHGPNEIYYAVINSHTQPWVVVADDGSESLKLDDSVSNYLELAHKLYEGDYTNNGSHWDSGWYANMQDGGNVFCYFGCPWFVGVMRGGNEDYGTTGATDGEWGACVGPQSYYWGGTYVSIGKDTPNPELAAFIAYELAFDPEVGVNITNQYGDAVVNKTANDMLASGSLADDNTGVAFLGGQNPYATWAAAAEGIDQSAVTYADKNYEKYIDDALTGYNTGLYSSIDDAIKYIYDKSNSELGIPAAE